jgi:hypothetical protein
MYNLDEHAVSEERVEELASSVLVFIHHGIADLNVAEPLRNQSVLVSSHCEYPC